MKKMIRSMLLFNEGSVHSEKEFQEMYNEIAKLNKKEFNYEYSKSKSTYASFEKIIDMHSSVLLASFFGYAASAYLEGHILNKVLLLPICIFFMVRAEVNYTIPRLSMKVDVYEAVGRDKWKN